MDNEKLLQHAIEAKKCSYAPYSNFHVGACLLTKDGDVFTGCNIENATFGATNCAERTAIFKAVSEGYTEFEKIAIVGEQEDKMTFPCGICLQVMMEFMPKGKVVLMDGEQIREFSVTELLPYGFQLEHDR